MREGDRGIYVSTGGFAQEGKYEAERAERPVTLVDLDDLVALVVEHYEKMDIEARTLVPLKRLYWPEG
jgi:restriction system protein